MTKAVHRSIRLSVSAAILGLVSTLASANPDKPNFLVIVADDLGYSDIGSFGGEIETPSLDAIANSGTRLTNFVVAPTCSPTRSMLLSGTDSHLAGLGNMAEVVSDTQKGEHGYEGFLNASVATLPEVLGDAGYETFMAGKWHLGRSEEHSPAARGFNNSFALIQGGASSFSDMSAIQASDPVAIYRADGKQVDGLPEDFFATHFYTDKAIEYIDNAIAKEKPFFGYLAYTAPHWPLQAPDAYLDKYTGRYEEGYEAIREARLKRMKELGIVADNIEVGPFIGGLPKWDELTDEEREIEARRMEVYAAMVDNLDANIGRLMDWLDKKGRLDNTVILFASDNGAEGNNPTLHPQTKQWIAEKFDNSLENMGRKGSYIWYGPQWGQVGSTPFAFFKGFTSEGGIRAPAIIRYPDQNSDSQGSIDHSLYSVMDVMPTFLELAGVKAPDTPYKGRDIHPIQGMSMLNSLAAAQNGKERVLGWELFGRTAIRKGDWKLRHIGAPFESRQWALFNVKSDPAELVDLSDEYPDKVSDLKAEWKDYAERNNVIELTPEEMQKIGYSFYNCVFDHCI
ncbi:arylsulfatase [Marinobacter sp. GN3S48]|uniref:arylsulfatase n=1 Tax=Marinobacter sp. GN3S48 TaxID=3382302 RepID=UPI00387B9DBE